MSKIEMLVIVVFRLLVTQLLFCVQGRSVAMLPVHTAIIPFMANKKCSSAASNTAALSIKLYT